MLNLFRYILLKILPAAVQAARQYGGGIYAGLQAELIRVPGGILRLNLLPAGCARWAGGVIKPPGRIRNLAAGWSMVP